MEITTGNPALDAEAQAIREERARLTEAQRALNERTKALVIKLRPRIVARRVAALVGLHPARISQIEQGK